jgi:geranylgeranyl pyrophosphate synthase
VTGTPATAVPIEAYLADLRADVDGAIVAMAELRAPAPLAGAMRYVLGAGGKRLRPCLTLASAEAVASLTPLDPLEARARARPAACAVEFIHTYSLVHDDLPAMDDDARRRGRPTAHVVYGDGLAILVGDALLTEAFGLIASPPPLLAPARGLLDAATSLRQVAVLAAAAGAAGMVGGQAIDLAAAGKVTGVDVRGFDADALEDMHARKTGALIRAAAVLGALAAGASMAIVDAVDAYARDLGLAFQIIDDVLDVESSSEALGKTAGKDAAAGKPTYPALYGLDRSRSLAADCAARAQATLASASIGGRLGDIVRWSLGRKS